MPKYTASMLSWRKRLMVKLLRITTKNSSAENKRKIASTVEIYRLATNSNCISACSRSVPKRLSSTLSGTAAATMPLEARTTKEAALAAPSTHILSTKPNELPRPRQFEAAAGQARPKAKNRYRKEEA